MGMPITVEIVDQAGAKELLEMAYDYFRYVDETFSTYKQTSEVTKINKGMLLPDEYSDDMKIVMKLCEETKRETNGYFDIQRSDGTIDPSGLVKGWSIQEAAKLLKENGMKNFFVEAGGDIQVGGHNAEGKKWRVGIRNPFAMEQIVKVLGIEDHGIATSGTYIRGQHIYNPFHRDQIITDIVSLTVIGPNVYEADRFATAAFAMGKEGIQFIERLEGFEGYMIDKDGIATFTSHFDSFTL